MNAAFPDAVIVRRNESESDADAPWGSHLLHAAWPWRMISPLRASDVVGYAIFWADPSHCDRQFAMTANALSFCSLATALFLYAMEVEAGAEVVVVMVATAAAPPHC